jgi:hypothetical protein
MIESQKIVYITRLGEAEQIFEFSRAEDFFRYLRLLDVKEAAQEYDGLAKKFTEKEFAEMFNEKYGVKTKEENQND